MERTAEQIAEMINLYRVCYPHLAQVNNHGPSRAPVWNRPPNDTKVYLDRKSLTSARYLINDGIPKMRAKVPIGVLRLLGVDLDELEKKCSDWCERFK